MKTRKIVMSSVVLWFLLSIIPLSCSTQKKVDGPPPWAPAHGYRAQVRHIYFPEYNIYFDLKRNVYMFMSGDNWVVGVNLPPHLAKENLKRAAKIELELNIDDPYRFNADHKGKYKVQVKATPEKKKPNKEKKIKYN
ncbi:MAG TPA: hypothetical protein DCX03_00700 [Bacteroidales bacterium]|nr:hypothetical protein [Bacteroidales bacterium]